MNLYGLSRLWMLAVVVTSLYLWIVGGWFHLELLNISEYASTRGLQAIFDWTYFDSNPTRLRILSDLLEVIDAIFRPYSNNLFSHYPSITFTSLIIAITTPFFFYGAIRSMGLSRIEALLFTGLFISSIAYLSSFVPYIRPAKRLAMLGLCCLVFFAFRFRLTGKDWYLRLALLVTFLNFFSDEAGYIFWLILGLFIWNYSIKYYKIWYLLLPPIFFIVSKVLLPPIYEAFGKTGPRNSVLNSEMIIGLFQNIFTIKFWNLAIEDLATAVSATFGLISPSISIVALILVATLIFSFYKKWSIVIIWLIAITLTSFFFTFIDGVNTTKNNLGQWTYYYHASIAPLSILCVISIYLNLKPISKYILYILALLCMCITFTNFKNFQKINEIVKIIHTYPIATINPLVVNSNLLVNRYDELLKDLNLLQEVELRKQFEYYIANPMGTDDYSQRLRKILGLSSNK